MLLYYVIVADYEMSFSNIFEKESSTTVCQSSKDWWFSHGEASMEPDPITENNDPW